jgi:hypothetical protein
LGYHHQADNSAQFSRILADHWAWIASSAVMPPYARHGRSKIMM